MLRPQFLDSPLWLGKVSCITHDTHFVGLTLAGLRRRTPGPPPFSSMKSTPAFLSTASILSSDFWSPA
jgi:hypothetical protein